MPSGIHKNHKGGSSGTRIKPKFTPQQVAKMTKLLNNCVEKGLEFAEKVLSNKEKVEIVRFTRTGVQEKFKADKYSPEMKLKILEIVIGKVFAERKDVGIDPPDDSDIQVVGFNFTPIKKSKEGE